MPKWPYLGLSVLALAAGGRGLCAQSPEPGREKRPPKAAALAAAPAPRAYWAPPDIDEEIPAVTPGVPCALPELLEATTARVKTLVANLEHFTATERLEHLEVGENGKARAHKARSFKYLVFFREIRPRFLAVEEFRDGVVGPQIFFTKLGTDGLPALILIFHPYYFEDFEMACEGLGQWRGQAAWQVHFQQRPDRPSRIYGFRVGPRSHPVSLKGRAWIAADSNQILRLEADVVEPMKEIKLQRSHKVIEYHPVLFEDRKIQLWLPESADIYMQYRGHRYQIRHRFSDYLLFSVDVKEQQARPRQ